MSTPSQLAADSGALQHVSPPSAAADEDMGDIPRRPMRVKVLYTFDDQNQTNCLARVPNALSVPVVSLDENTQVGVIELKTCIQAIVAASPELVAKLGHDYTVYAYDYSEYETPLVGQGMLSWILASASSTPNAPADESQTMVTGRVCKNMLAIYTGGVKETLEVKLKLVPVPTCMQKEYVENMERYHSLSQLMPEGFDYRAWSDFLKENPTLGQLAQPTPAYPAQHSPHSSFGGVEPFHQMLTRQSPAQDPPRNDSFYDQHNASFNAQTTRASSPAMSTISFHHYQYNPESRPASRASVRSEVAPQTQPFPFSDSYVMEQQEEGPPKKRARITQAKRPRKTPLTAPNDSLRVTASTAASVRLHRPAVGNSVATADLIPRAPTPRPGDAFGRRNQPRPPAPSALRQASVDYGRPYMSPYDTAAFSDNAGESADERDGSPAETPMDIPSSPPVAPQDPESPSPSSPTLPTFPPPADSGFVSDMPMSRDEDGLGLGDRRWEESDLPLATDEPQLFSLQQPWQRINHHRQPGQSIAKSIEQDARVLQPSEMELLNNDFFNTGSTQHGQMGISMEDQRIAPTDSFPFAAIEQRSREATQLTAPKAESPDVPLSHISPGGESETQEFSRSATPNLPPRKPKPSKPRGLPRSHTWSGTGEPMSDAPTPADSGQPRSGSGAKRKKYIKDKLEKAIANGEMPQHCVNCGEIDTPTWRKAYTRVETGSPEGVELTTDTASTGVIGYEVIESAEDTDKEPKYRLFKNHLTREEQDLNTYELLNLCNPCGLWLIKKAAMRPRKLWDKAAKAAERSDRPKRKRNQGTGMRAKSMSQGDDLVSDAIVPDSEPVMPSEHEDIHASFDGNIDRAIPVPLLAQERSSGQAATGESEVDFDAAHALRRALESSPAGFRGSKNSPINIDADLTPKPTRRILFPSPRQDGEIKSLAAEPHTVLENVANHIADKEVPDKPRCKRCKELKKGCDRERPCKRCDNAGIGFEGCVPCEPKRTNWFEQPVVQIAAIDDESPDKENCPPTFSQEQDDFAHLFESPVSPKTTPKKDQFLQDLLKTPTPGSRHRLPLTPRRSADDNDHPTTPSRVILTPRGLTPRSTRAATIAPETPFTRQLKNFLSDWPVSSSPSQAIDFSAFPTFTTPGRSGPQFSEFLNDEFLSSDMPMPSSPPKGGSLGMGFALYEDPNTSTVGLWSGANIFESDTIMGDLDNSSKNLNIDLDDGPDATTLLKMNVGGMTVDFSAMIEEVVATANAEDAEDKPSPEAQSQGVGSTPEEPVVV